MENAIDKELIAVLKKVCLLNNVACIRLWRDIGKRCQSHIGFGNQDCIEPSTQFKERAQCHSAIRQNFISQGVNHANLLAEEQLPRRLDCHFKLWVHFQSQSQWNQQIYRQHQAQFDLQRN